MGVPKYISPEEAAAAAATASQAAAAAGGEAAVTAARALADMMGGGLDANAAAIANAAPCERPAWMDGDAAGFSSDQASEVLCWRCPWLAQCCHGITAGSRGAYAAVFTHAAPHARPCMIAIWLLNLGCQPGNPAASHDWITTQGGRCYDL